MTGDAHRLRDTLTGSALVIATLALSLFYSRGRIMWSDELFGWMLVTDPSLRHMLHAWNAGADGGGLFFYLLARLWLGVFGHTATALRLFSAAGVALSALFTFRTARRFFRWGIAAFCVTLLWFSSDIVLWQIMQGRFYGMLLAGVAAASYLFVLASSRPTRKLLALTFLCHSLLVGTHPFGVLYSATIILVMIASDRFARRLRPRLYLSALSGWWILALSVTAMRNSAAVGKPHFWTTRPGLSDLGNVYSCWSLPAAIVLGAVATLFIALLCLGKIPRQKISAALAANRPVLLLCIGLLSVPLFTFLISQRGTSVFVDRYLVPVVIGICLSLCQMLSLVLPPVISTASSPILVRRISWALALAGVPVLAFIAVVQFPSYWQVPAPDLSLTLVSLLPKDLPVVVEPVDLFDQLLAFHRSSGYHFIYLLDWENVSAPESPRGEVSGYHQMEIWKHVGYFSGSIQESQTFLAQTPAFIVVEDPRLPWFKRKVLPNATFEIEPLGQAHGGPDPMSIYKVWLVRKHPCHPHSQGNSAVRASSDRPTEHGKDK